MELPTYTSIWRIEKRLYKLYDFRLPMPVPVGQIAVFAAITVPYVVLLTVLGLPFNHTLFWLYVLPPGVITWLATRPVLESKRLPELLISQVRYLSEPAAWCRMAPLAEKDEIVVVGRVWRRDKDLRPAPEAEPEPERPAAPLRGRPAGTPQRALPVTAGPVPTAAPRGRAIRHWADPTGPGDPAVRPGGPGDPAVRPAQPSAAKVRAVDLPPARPAPAPARPTPGSAPAPRPVAPGAWAAAPPPRPASPVPPAPPVSPPGRALPVREPAPASPPAAPVAGFWVGGSPPDRPAPGADRPLADEHGPAVPGDRPARQEGDPLGRDGALAAARDGAAPAGTPLPVRPPEVAHENRSERPIAALLPLTAPPRPADPGESLAPAGLGESAGRAGLGESLAGAASSPAVERAPSAAADGHIPLSAETAAAGGPGETDDPPAAAGGPPGAAPQVAAPEVAAPEVAAPEVAGPEVAGPAPATSPVVVVRGNAQNRAATVERALSGPGQLGGTAWRAPVRVIPGGHGPGRPDLERRDRARVQLPIDGPRLTVVLGCTVGAGQSVTALMLAGLLARERAEAVAALDLNPGPGSLATLARCAPAGTARSLLAGDPPPPAAQGRARCDVIAHDAVPDGRGELGDADYARLGSVLTNRYALTLADPGASAVARLLSVADQLVLVVPASADASRAVAMTMEWLDGHGHAELAGHSIAVVNGVSKRSMTHVEQAELVVRGRCRAIVRIPWDDHLAVPPPGPGARERPPGPGADASGFGQLRPPAQHAYTALAGVLVAALATVPAAQRQAPR